MVATAAATNADPGAELVTNQETVDNDAVAKSLAAVNDIIGNVAKMVAGNPVEPAAAAPAAPAAVSDEDTEKAKAENPARVAFETTMKEDFGMDGENLVAAMKKFDKRFDRGQKFPSAQPPLNKKVKKEADPEPEPEVESDVVTYESLEKAKRFTPARIAKLAEALDILKLVMEGISPGTSPKNNLPTGGSFGASGLDSMSSGSVPTKVSKSAEEAISEGLVTLCETFKSGFGAQAEITKTLVAKVAEIENTRSGGNGGGAENTETKKSAGSIWGGLL